MDEMTLKEPLEWVNWSQTYCNVPGKFLPMSPQLYRVKASSPILTWDLTMSRTVSSRSGILCLSEARIAPHKQQWANIK